MEQGIGNLAALQQWLPRAPQGVPAVPAAPEAVPDGAGQPPRGSQGLPG